MIMKKILVILFLLPLFSCNDWLDVESEISVTYLNYFKGEGDLQKVVYAILSNEKKILAPVNVQAFGWCGLLCDHAGAREGYRTLKYGSYFGNVMESWSPQYSMLYLANMMEENRFRFENVSKDRAEFWLAQANFAKALGYYDLARKWGEAPLAPSTESIDAVGKSSPEVLLNEALRCAEAALVLPTHEKLVGANGEPLTSKQYASLGTVHTLLANIYAWMGGLYGEDHYWEKAIEHATLVIDKKVGYYELEDSISLVVKKTLGPGRVSDETIFAIEFSQQDDDWFGSPQFACRYPGEALISYPYLEVNAGDVNSKNIPKISVATVKRVYPEEKDVRRKEYWYNLGEVKYQMEHPFYPGEYVDVTSSYAFLNKWNSAIFTDNPVIIGQGNEQVVAMDGNRVIWRLADLILLRGECRSRLKMTSAVEDLNRIRRRAGLGDYQGGMAAEDLRQEIFHERERELFGEGHRYYDIVRNGYFREELSRTHRELTDDDVKNGALYLPVSRNSFTKNPLLTQNTYWLWHQE